MSFFSIFKKKKIQVIIECNPFTIKREYLEPHEVPIYSSLREGDEIHVPDQKDENKKIRSYEVTNKYFNTQLNNLVIFTKQKN